MVVYKICTCGVLIHTFLKLCYKWFPQLRRYGVGVRVNLFFRAISGSHFRKVSTLILAFSWISGLLFGVFLFCAASDSVFALMGGCAFDSVSIVTLMQAYMLPFLISALAVFLSFPWMLPVICFGKAVLFSFVFCGLTLAWGTSAFFIRWTLLGFDLLSMPLLYFWWHRSISSARRVRLLDMALYMLPIPAIAFLVYAWVIPFMADVLIL